MNCQPTSTHRIEVENLPKPTNGVPSRGSGEASRAAARVATDGDIGECFGMLILGGLC